LKEQAGRAFQERRKRVLERLGDRALMVIAAAPEIRVGFDTEFRYAVDPELYYLTGFTEPEAVLVLSGVTDHAPFTLFVRPRDRERETWTGPRGGVESALAVSGADAAFPVTELETRLPGLLADADTIFARLRTGRPAVDEAIVRALSTARHARPRRGRGPHTVVDPGAVLDDLRLFKDGQEMEAVKAAAAITLETFLEAARDIRAGTGEWQLEAAMDAGFRKRGASGPAFPTIVASGPNATVLHHVGNDRILEAADAVLIDAGARYAMYCADVSRTFPVSGRFGDGQRALYDIVLAAHDAAISASRPGATIAQVHDAARHILESGLEDLGLIGPAGAEGRDVAVKAFYPHRTSHWLGLEVHDVGDYVRAGEPRRLEPGMVFTIEPGLYVSRDCEEAAARLRGLGIRIEDEVLITPSGHEVLTGALPTDPDTIERLIE
jgi:Xaa-Pro aminopeptidase